ncbi:MAG: NADP-dependent phosphogluconate dehydrogenase [Nitrososphaerota archaeon]
MTEIGLIGLGVMGENLARNIASRGYTVTVYNRSAAKTREFLAKVATERGISGVFTLDDFVATLDRPRKVILMVKAGHPVDEVLNKLAPKLNPGDMVFDCGNSHYLDTERRQRKCGEEGLVFMGVGVSGGEEGALKGPAVMIGGSRQAYEDTRGFWEAIAARAEDEPCAGYMGLHGAGHFVKMVHNGIEYGMLQLVAEAYDIMTGILDMDVDAVRDVFRDWNAGELGSYLLEIAVDALSIRDDESGRPLVELVLDKAEQKGTGKWAVQTAAELIVPAPSIDAALSARYLSAAKDTRLQFARVYGDAPAHKPEMPARKILEMLEDGYWCAAVVCYAQGLELIRAASREYGYGTNLCEVLKVWRGGCIIRARMIQDFIRALQHDENILLDSHIVSEIKRREESWNTLLSEVKKAGIPTPVMDASHNYLRALRRPRLPANLIQALRDRFGAHTFERIDKPGRFHHSWRP